MGQPSLPRNALAFLLHQRRPPGPAGRGCAPPPPHRAPDIEPGVGPRRSRGLAPTGSGTGRAGAWHVAARFEDVDHWRHGRHNARHPPARRLIRPPASAAARHDPTPITAAPPPERLNTGRRAPAERERRARGAGLGSTSAAGRRGGRSGTRAMGSAGRVPAEAAAISYSEPQGAVAR